MSCGAGKPCREARNRRLAFGALGSMAAIFIGLSAVSFIDSRNQAVPDAVHYGAHDAVEGKRVFQAYNCMGCHTLLGNGAYLGPDLTNTYELAGPAWLSAFLPSAGTWPTGPGLQVHLQKPEQVAATGTSNLDDYFKRYPGADERVRRRGGGSTHMPNLPLTGEQVDQLIAFLRYTSEMNTEGWPPKPKVDGLKSSLASPFPGATASVSTAAPAGDVPATAADPAALGAQLAKDYACTSCHALDDSRLVGPGWGGLHGSQVSLVDGSAVTADDAFLRESILEPDARVAAGYAAGTMPSYAGQLDDDQVGAIVAYIRTLSEDRP